VKCIAFAQAYARWRASLRWWPTAAIVRTWSPSTVSCCALLYFGAVGRTASLHVSRRVAAWKMCAPGMQLATSSPETMCFRSPSLPPASASMATATTCASGWTCRLCWLSPETPGSMQAEKTSKRSSLSSGRVVCAASSPNWHRKPETTGPSGIIAMSAWRQPT